jgi:purine catabolism regulator
MMICDAAGPGRKWAGEIWGPQPAAPLHVSVFRGRPPVLRRLVESLELDGSSRFPLFFAELRDEVVVLSAATDPRALAWLISLAGKGAYLGVSSPINDAAIGHGQRQARDAAETAHRSGVPAIRFEDLAGARLLDVVPQEAAEAFAVSLLKPVLDDDDKHPGRLIESLRVWLSHNGQCEPAAKRLGIHRHTLTQRMRTVEQLTQRSLDSPGFRAELWVALHALDKPH